MIRFYMGIRITVGHPSFACILWNKDLKDLFEYMCCCVFHTESLHVVFVHANVPVFQRMNGIVDLLTTRIFHAMNYVEQTFDISYRERLKSIIKNRLNIDDTVILEITLGEKLTVHQSQGYLHCIGYAAGFISKSFNFSRKTVLRNVFRRI